MFLSALTEPDSTGALSPGHLLASYPVPLTTTAPQTALDVLHPASWFWNYLHGCIQDKPLLQPGLGCPAGFTSGEYLIFPLILPWARPAGWKDRSGLTALSKKRQGGAGRVTHPAERLLIDSEVYWRGWASSPRRIDLATHSIENIRTPSPNCRGREKPFPKPIYLHAQVA